MAAAATEFAKRNQSLLKGAAVATSSALVGTYLLCKTQTSSVLSDIRETIELVRLRNEMNGIQNSPNWTVYDLFQNNVKERPNADCMCFVGEPNKPARTLSFKQVDEEANKSMFECGFVFSDAMNLILMDVVANWAISEGITNGDVVGLIMDNRPEFVITWLGISKIGGVTALINTNLVNDPLLHSMTISNATRFIVGM